MQLQVDDLVMLIHPVLAINKDRIGIIRASAPIVARIPVADHWIIEYSSEVMTTCGPYKFSCTPGWRLKKITGPDVDIGITEYIENVI